jgi:hypothetical protein
MGSSKATGDQKWQLCDAKYHKLKFGRTSIIQLDTPNKVTSVNDDTSDYEVALGKNNEKTVAATFANSDSTNSTSLMSTP